MAMTDSPNGKSLLRSKARSILETCLVAADVALALAALEYPHDRGGRHQERVCAGSPHQFETRSGDEQTQFCPTEAPSGVSDFVVAAPQTLASWFHQTDQAASLGHPRKLVDDGLRVGIHAMTQRCHAENCVEGARTMRDLVDVRLDGPVSIVIVNRRFQGNGFEIVENGGGPIGQPRPRRARPAAGIEIDGVGVHRCQVRADQHLQQCTGRAIPPVPLTRDDHSLVLVVIHLIDLCMRRSLSS
jgi:hypothetical protein